MVSLGSNILRISIFILVLALSQSCIMGQSRWEILQGNLAYGRGDYHQATLHYLEALKLDLEHSDWISYNLGNVYHSLGETDASSRMWANAEKTEDQELLFAVLYNQGVAAYEAGRYRDALTVFRQALNLKPAHRGVKINLELTQQKIAASRGGSAPSTNVVSNESLAEDSARVLDYVRRKEERFWFSLRKDDQSVGDNDW